MTPISLCLIAKYPPIQGGVSQQCYWLAHNLAEAGHRVHVVTNAMEVEADYRIFIPREERARLEGETPGGGHVRLHTTTEAGLEGTYIPYTNPFVSKLAALASDVIAAHRCDMIWSAYLEPYGVAGYLASSLTGVPFAVRHAGSDIAILAQIEARRGLYLDVLRRADLVVTARFLYGMFGRAGVGPERLYAAPRSAVAAAGFTPEGPALDVDAVLDEAAESDLAPRRRPSGPFDPSLPTIGIYGKVSPYKGMFELVEALGQVAASGRRFNLIMLVGTRGAEVERLDTAIARAGIDEVTYRLPFLPHWMVPRFLRACTAVCYLENRFPISIHTPQVGFEIQACGRCLIVSEEVVAKTQRRAEDHDGESAIVVRDPTDVAELRGAVERVIADPAAARAIGARGRALVAPMFTAGDVSSLVKRLRRVVEESRSMSMEGLQRTLFDLYADPAFCAALAARPDEALGGRDLDERERAAVLEVGRKLLPKVERFGEMLIHKRIEYYLELFGATAPHLGAHRAALVAAFTKVYDFRHRHPIEDVAYFAGFLRDFAAAPPAAEGAPLPPYLGDLIRYDERMWQAETGADGEGKGFDQLLEIRIEQAPVPAPLSPEDAVTVGPGVIIERFEVPVQRIVSGGEGEIKPSPTFIAFTPRRGGLSAQAHAMNGELMHLVSGAAGGSAVADLLDAAAARYPGRPAEAVRTAALRALQQLVERHVLVRQARSG